ncbi:MAG: amidohydrolase family protein [Acidobacteria bacterium]|nr:amidohydrolase family protein [Acidobacteriota bacterium]
MRIVIATLAVLVAALPCAAQPADTLSDAVRQFVEVAESTVALTGVQVVDGTGSPAASGQTILIRDGRIAAVALDTEVEIPDGARVLALDGHTVVPGFVGLHDHTFYMTRGRRVQLNFSAPRLYLASGVTAIRTTGAFSPYSELNLKRSIQDGQEIGPRMFITGPYLSGAGAMSQMFQVSTPEDARRVVAYWADEGVDWFKAYTRIGDEELAAAIDEAHRRGVKVTGHLCSVSFREAVALGIDNIEHGFFTNSDYVPDKQPGVCPPGVRQSLLEVDLEGEEVAATIREMVEEGVAMTSTLPVYELAIPNRPPLEQRVLDMLAPGARDEYLQSRADVASRDDAPMAELFPKAQAFERMFVEAGGLLAAGVDPTGMGGALPGYGDQRNYELLLESGFSPEQVIQIMSLNGARVLGEDERFGSIEPGKLADLVVIDGDPVRRAAEIRNVTLVFKEGVGYDAPALAESVRGLVGLR